MRKALLTAMCCICINISSVNANSPDVTFSIINNEPTKLSTLIHAMAKKAGMSAVVNPSIDGNVLISFENTTITDAMELLGDSYGFSWYIRDNTVVVSPQTEMVTRNQKFYLQFANPDLVKEELKAFIDEKSIIVNPETSSVSIDSSIVNLNKAAIKIRDMDKPPQQILIKAQIVELTDSLSRDLGFKHEWGSYSNQMETKNILYSVTAEARDIIDKGKVIATPTIMTINGLEAVLEMGGKYPVLMRDRNSDGSTDTTVEYKDIGYFLTAIPRINNLNQEDEYVTMSVTAQSSTITGWVENSDTKAPQMSSRNAKTNVRVKNGETIIIGGLVKDEELKTINKVPGLGNIPLIGNLFKHRSKSHDKSEIFIFLTPHIIHFEESKAGDNT